MKLNRKQRRAWRQVNSSGQSNPKTQQPWTKSEFVVAFRRKKFNMSTFLEPKLIDLSLDLSLD